MDANTPPFPPLTMSVSPPRQTFFNPTIPFNGTVLGGFLPGEMVLVQGSVPSDADRFQIDFTCGSSVKPRADVAFHFNPRLNKKSIVCNTLTKERWGREEILHLMPFSCGGSFELVFLVLKDEFKVAVNGAHVLAYKHRMDLELVDTLSISGKVKVEAVAVLPSSSSATSSGGGTNQDTALMKTADQSEQLFSSSADLTVPFRGELVKGLVVGRSIVVKGRTNQSARSFCVNLRASAGDDIALHLNPRLEKEVLVRNSFLSGCWGSEETALADAFPFRAGEYFEMIVLCDAQQFRVAVNGRHLLVYKHRVQDLSCVTQLEVTGDVTLEDVRLL